MGATRAIGRALISVIFILGGMKFMDLKGSTGYAATGLSKFGITDPSMQLTLVTIATVLECVGGLLLALGFEDLAVPLLASFLLPVTVIMHTDFNNQMEQVTFWKNMGLFGALLYIYSAGAERKSGKPKSS